MLIINSRPFVDGAFKKDVAIRVLDGFIRDVSPNLRPTAGETVVDAQGDYLLPGFVDEHIHAHQGHDTMNGEANVRFMSRALYQMGVAAFTPTTMSASVADTKAAIEGIRAVMDRPETPGALVIGAHMEAPFLAEEKCGAQLKEHFCNPSMAAFQQMTGGDVKAVKLITMAPERPGAEGFIRQITAQGVRVSIGHTCADAETTHHAAGWGATHVTHSFNAQTPLLHRAPGVPGAALVDDRLYMEMICDGIHLHPDIIRLIVRAKTPAKTIMVTDAMEAAGMPDGTYNLGGQDVFVQDGAARLASGVLAGSVLTMVQALQNMICRFGIAPEETIPMCTATPADALGVPTAGRIAPGCLLPLTRWSRDWAYRGIVGS